MADTVTCCSCSLSSCVRLLCFLLLLLHLVVGVVSLATGHVHYGSSFFQNVFCPNITNNYTIACLDKTINLDQINAPYLLNTNHSGTAIFDQDIFCSNISTNKTFIETQSPCSAMELNMAHMIIPYMQAINIILFISNAALLVCGVTRLWCNIVYLVIQIAAALQALILTSLLIFTNKIQGVQVSINFHLYKPCTLLSLKTLYNITYHLHKAYIHY